jgi:hypothetical protein
MRAGRLDEGRRTVVDARGLRDSKLQEPELDYHDIGLANRNRSVSETEYQHRARLLRSGTLLPESKPVQIDETR